MSVKAYTGKDPAFLTAWRLAAHRDDKKPAPSWRQWRKWLQARGLAWSKRDEALAEIRNGKPSSPSTQKGSET